MSISREIQNILVEEEELYRGRELGRRLHKRYFIWRYLRSFRLCQYYRELRVNAEIGGIGRRIAKIKFRWYEREMNTFAWKSGVEIGLQCKIGRGLDIWHGGVIINGDIGEYCCFHGNNIVGNKGKGREKQFPVIGNHVDFGAGAIAIGAVQLADNCVLGAGAVVTRSCYKSGAVLIGCPAKELYINQ